MWEAGAITTITSCYAANRSQVPWRADAAQNEGQPRRPFQRLPARVPCARWLVRQEGYDLVREAPHPLIETRAVVGEVDDEAVAAGIEVLAELLGDRVGRAGNGVPASLVPAGSARW